MVASHRTFSPPLSVVTAETHVGHTKLNIVSRLVVEGKAKRDADRSRVRLFMKFAIPIDSTTPGSSIPLFNEESARVHDFAVHPLDANSVPYIISSPKAALLYGAIRALNLPAPSSKSYTSLFNADADNHEPADSKPQVNGSVVPVLEDRYTGYILISGYQICYVAPKAIPPRHKLLSFAQPNGEIAKNGYHPGKTRRSSIGEKAILNFMVCLEISVPYLSKPPKAPFLMSIPLPRCLSNTIRFRIFTPATTSSSFASLSSEEGSAGWDLLTEPHVTRTTSKQMPRPDIYNDLADDESSDSSSVTSFSDGRGIQGTFPSSERLLIRWATPVKDSGKPPPSDGRRRVGIMNARGKMTCTILGEDDQGLKVAINYEAVCKGLWFPGVATMLAMDLALDSRNCDIAWASDSEPTWTITGGTGFTGSSADIHSRLNWRQPSLEYPQLSVQTASPNPKRVPGLSNLSSRSSSTSSSASLLRAPLPTTNGLEYSFEESTPASSTAPSFVASLTPVSSQATGDRLAAADPPTAPIVIYLNINDLIPPHENSLTFSISGTLSLKPRSSMSVSRGLVGQAITLPMFQVLEAETEVATTMIRNQYPHSRIEIAGPAIAGSTDPCVLYNGSQMRCGSGAATAFFRDPPSAIKEEPSSPLLNQVPSPPNGDVPKLANALQSPSLPIIHHRSGPLIITRASATVTPLTSMNTGALSSYAVNLSLPVPVDNPSEWLEFGFALPSHGKYEGPSKRPAKATPRLEITSASISDVPIRFETYGHVKEPTQACELDDPDSKQWLTWVRVHAPSRGRLELVYTVKQAVENPNMVDKGKRKVEQDVDILLPVFTLPLGKWEVIVNGLAGYQMTFSTNIAYQRIKTHEAYFFHVDLPELSFIRLDMNITPSPNQSRSFNALQYLKATLIILPIIIYILMLRHAYSVMDELTQLRALMSPLPTAIIIPNSASDFPSVTPTVPPTPFFTDPWSETSLTTRLYDPNLSISSVYLNPTPEPILIDNYDHHDPTLNEDSAGAPPAGAPTTRLPSAMITMLQSHVFDTVVRPLGIHIYRFWLSIRVVFQWPVFE